MIVLPITRGRAGRTVVLCAPAPRNGTPSALWAPPPNVGQKLRVTLPRHRHLGEEGRASLKAESFLYHLWCCVQQHFVIASEPHVGERHGPWSAVEDPAKEVKRGARGPLHFCSFSQDNHSSSRKCRRPPAAKRRGWREGEGRSSQHPSALCKGKSARILVFTPFWIPARRVTLVCVSLTFCVGETQTKPSKPNQSRKDRERRLTCL